MVVHLAGTGDHVNLRYLKKLLEFSFTYTFHLVFLAEEADDGQTVGHRIKRRIHHPREPFLRVAQTQRAKVLVQKDCGEHLS